MPGLSKEIPMDDHLAEALLRDALQLMNDRPNFGLRRDPGFTSYWLAARIDLYFATRSTSCPGAAQSETADGKPTETKDIADRRSGDAALP